MRKTSETRRRMMQSVRSKNTGPELLVRKLLHARGYRYRLHKRDLPGSPDIAFTSRKMVIFVNGCFWHGHACANGMRQPKTNVNYWQPKIARTRARDANHLRELVKLGWKAITVWECEMEDLGRLSRRLAHFLG